MSHDLNHVFVSQRLCRSRGKGGLHPRPDHVGFEVGKDVMRHLIFRKLRFVPGSIIPRIPFPLPRVFGYSDLLTLEKRLP